MVGLRLKGGCHDAFDKLWGLEVGFTPFHNWALFFMLLLAALARLGCMLDSNSSACLD